MANPRSKGNGAQANAAQPPADETVATGNTSSRTASVTPPTVEDPAPAHPARVAQARYSENTGWDVGQSAPSDQYREIGQDGAYVGKASSTPPKGKPAVQVAVKGDVVTEAMRRAVGKD